MFSISVKYEDYNGNQREEQLYFNLNKTELLDLEVHYPGGIEEYLKQIAEALNREELVNFIHDLLKRSYGVKDPSGKRFIKSEEVFSEFKESNAYEEIFLKLLTDDDFAYDFLTSVVPMKDVKVPTKEEIRNKIEERKNTNLIAIDGEKR